MHTAGPRQPRFLFPKSAQISTIIFRRSSPPDSRNDFCGFFFLFWLLSTLRNYVVPVVPPKIRYISQCIRYTEPFMYGMLGMYLGEKLIVLVSTVDYVCSIHVGYIYSRTPQSKARPAAMSVKWSWPLISSSSPCKQPYSIAVFFAIEGKEKVSNDFNLAKLYMKCIRIKHIICVSILQ